jgi:hypothetical protein
MKRTLFLLFLVGALLSAQSQQVESQISTSGPYEKHNEIKINGLYFVLGAFDLIYERNLSEESSLGISVFLPFDENVRDEIQYYISPYYRFFFGKKYAAGFFVEGFGMLNSYEEDITSLFSNGDGEENYVTDFALGFGLGGKWVTKKGFMAEVSWGIGRNLFDAGNLDIVLKYSISLGYRF